MHRGVEFFFLGFYIKIGKVRDFHGEVKSNGDRGLLLLDFDFVPYFVDNDFVGAFPSALIPNSTLP